MSLARHAQQSFAASPRAPSPELDSEPSFTSTHFQTSTPRSKPSRSRPHPAPRPDETDDEDAPEHPTLGLRSSDTESLPADDLPSSTSRTRLTRRTLESISPASNPLPAARSRLHASMSREHSLQSAYAPTPSTGSSTLVERDDYAHGSGRDKGKGQARAPLGAIEQEDEREDRRASDAEVDGGESSSPARQPRSRGRGVGAYLEAHPAVYSTPPPLRQRSAPSLSTPLAPGAYPPTAQKSRASPTAHPSASPISASKEVHNIFSGLNIRPRASTSTDQPRAAQTPSRESPLARSREPPTPHGPGHYNFSPQTTRSPVPRNVRFGDAQTNGFGSESGDEASDEDEQPPPAPPPLPDPVLRKALRRIQQQKKVDDERAQELDDYFPEEREDERRRQQERPGDYEGDDDSSDGGAHAGGRSAIAYAMEPSRVEPEDLPMQSTPNPRRRATHEWDRTPPSPIRPTPSRRPISPPKEPSPPRWTPPKPKRETPTRRNPPTPPRSPSPELPPALPEFQSPVPSPEKPVRRPLRHPQPYPSPTRPSPPRARDSPPPLQSSTSSSHGRRRASQSQIPIPSPPRFAPSASTSRHRDPSPPRQPSPPPLANSHHRAPSPPTEPESSPSDDYRDDRLLETASELRLGLSSLKHERLNSLGLPSRDPSAPSALERKRKESDKRMRRLEQEQAELERGGTLARDRKSVV